MPIFYGKRPAGRCSAANGSDGTAKQTNRRPATGRPSVRTMRRAFHPLQQPTAVLSAMQGGCSPGTGAGTEPGGVSAKASGSTGAGGYSMTETLFRRFHSLLQRFMKASLRMKGLPHFRVSLPANEQAGSVYSEGVCLVVGRCIFSLFHKHFRRVLNGSATGRNKGAANALQPVRQR